MAIKYADSVYSFRSRTSLISQFVDKSPDAATLAQIESDLSDAAKAYYQGNYQDSVDFYKKAGALIYQYLDPMAFVYTAVAWDRVSKNPALFDPLLSAASVYMNVLPIPSPNPIRPMIAVNQAALGAPSVDQTGIRSTALNSAPAMSAAADMQAAADFRSAGLTANATALETRAATTNANVAGLFKGVAATPALASAAAATPAATAAVRLNTVMLAPAVSLAATAPVASARLATLATLPSTLTSDVLESRTLGLYTNGVATQVVWKAGATPDLTLVKNAVYTARVSAKSVLGDVLLNPQQPADIALSLPHDYYYTIPLGIAEALHALGDYANAESYYFQAAAYQYLNQAVEVPYLFRRLSQLYLDWGNSYFINADPASAQPIYEKVVTHAAAVPTSTLYTTTSLKVAADIARTIIGSIANVPALPNTINPDQIAIIVACYGALIKIVNGLDFWGSAANSVPIWTFEYLQSVAVNFCQLAIGAEQAFISYQDKADQGELTLQQLNQQAVQAQAEISAAQLQVAAASAEAGAYKAGLDLANLRSSDATTDASAYAAASWNQIQYQAETTQVQGGDDGDPDYVNYLADQLLSGNSISDSTATVSAATQLAGSKANRDYQIGSLQRTAAEMKQAAVQAQAELTAANARVTAAQADVTVAQLRASGAQAMISQFDSSYFTPDVWYAMGQTMYALYQRYFNMTIKVAKEMQNAYNFETDQLLHWIKTSYASNEVKGLLGADALMADIQQFTYDLVTATQSKPQPLRHTISLAGTYPYLFETQFRKTGIMDFETRVDDFDAAYPGTYAGRIQSVEVEVDGIVPVTGLSGGLSNSGISTYRVPSASWPVGGSPVKFRVQSKETLVLSDYTVRNDSLLFSSESEMLRIFEGAGVASSWHLEVPRAINDIDFGALTDVRLTFYYRARYDDTLKTRVLTSLAALPGVTSKARSLPLRWMYPDAFYAFQSSGSLGFTLRPRDFGRNETQPKLDNFGLMVTTNHSKPASGISLSVTAPGKAAITVVTDANGVVASGGASPLSALAGNPATGAYNIAMTAAANPTFVTGGKLDLSPIVNLTVMFEYDFTPRS
jgi:hypothetical protein